MLKLPEKKPRELAQQGGASNFRKIITQINEIARVADLEKGSIFTYTGCGIIRTKWKNKTKLCFAASILRRCLNRLHTQSIAEIVQDKADGSQFRVPVYFMVKK
jgi:hypothetical protein